MSRRRDDLRRADEDLDRLASVAPSDLDDAEPFVTDELRPYWDATLREPDEPSGPE